MVALSLFQATGDVAGVGPEELMDGGFRGPIRLVPQLPVNGYRKHLLWVVEGTNGIDRFKCGPAQNARAWSTLVDEFFAGRDLVPAC